MRGEHAKLMLNNLYGKGSSPHARGALKGEVLSGWCSRIIPACAGSTNERRNMKKLTKDHPRMRGEHSCHQDFAAPKSGSSPHARGARSLWCGCCQGSGIIPACAGSTGSWRPFKTRYRDHPRMRGEHSSCAPAPALTRGSSPHARGAQHARDETCGYFGIIPACAGSTHNSASC